MINENREIVTEVKFVINGKRDIVYDVLEDIRKVISNANNKEGISIVVDTETREGAIYSEDGRAFEDQATLNRWEELQESDIDLDAVVYLNRLKKNVEDVNLSEDALKQKINFFTENFLPKLLKEICIIIQDTMQDQIVNVNFISFKDDKKLEGLQSLKLGEINITVTQEIYQNNKTEFRQKIILLLQDFFRSKGISDKMVKNLDVNIINNDTKSVFVPKDNLGEDAALDMDDIDIENVGDEF